MSNRLGGKSALVTGSTSGIGRAIAAAFAAEGANVIVTGRRADQGAIVVDAIRAAGGSAEYVAADLGGSAADVAAFADRALEAAGGRIDILVNNAAQLVPATATVGLDPAVIDRALAVNVRVPLLLVSALAPAMIANGDGVIINIGSINGSQGMSGTSLYSATKGAVHMLTKAWAAEFGPAGIRVNTIAPGPTEVEWSAPIRDRLTAMVSGLPSGRMTLSSEVADVAVFLATGSGSNIHGATLPVDGGMANTVHAAV